VQRALDQEARPPGLPGARHDQGSLSGRAARGCDEPPGRQAPRPLGRPRLKPTTEVLRASDGYVYLLRGGDADYSIADDGVSRALLGALAEGLEIEALRGRLGELGVEVPPGELERTLAELYDLGLVEDASADDRLESAERVRFEGQLRYFSDLAPPWASRSTYQLRLREARVVVIGLGGLGCWTAYALAAAGIGRIDLIDGDAVELGNLNRQILYGESDVGEAKAEVAARVLRAFNSELEVRAICKRLDSQAQVEANVRGADFVLDAADWPPHEIEHWINRACFRLGVPYLTMSQYPPLVRVGPTYVPGATGCFACQETSLRRDFALFDELVEQRKGRPSSAATFGPACGVIGSCAALEAVHLLSGIARPASLGAAITIDLRTMETRIERVSPQPMCPVCDSGTR
jgi:bacteriocin biosynthesis cyclodehydratase domain-containing protein